MTTGAWEACHQAHGSTFKLLRTVGPGLILLKRFIENKTVQGLSDNITTIAFINKQGGSNRMLNKIAKLIHQETIDMNLNLVASYLSGIRNCKADQLSCLYSTYEWKPLKFVQDARPTLGSPSYRQVRVNDDFLTFSTISEFYIL